jgi:hypothetical protein
MLILAQASLPIVVLGIQYGYIGSFCQLLASLWPIFSRETTVLPTPPLRMLRQCKVALDAREEFLHRLLAVVGICAD